MSTISAPNDAVRGTASKEKPHGVLRALDAVASALAWVGGALSALLVIVVLAITTAGVLGRYVMGSPVEGVDEATGYLVVAMVMFGTAEALKSGHHIRIDLLFGMVGKRTRRVLDAWAHLAVLAFSILLFWTAWHTVVFSYEFEAYSSGQLELPLWIPQATLPLGAVLLAVVALAQFIRALVPGDHQ